MKPLSGRVAIVTGSNHGIGSATAQSLARDGADVLVAYYRVAPLNDPALPAVYDTARTGDAAATVDACVAHGARAVAVEADLTDPASIPLLFDRAEAEFGPVDIVINNASGWIKDTFLAAGPDWRERRTLRVSADTATLQLMVDGRATGLMISEFAERLMSSGRRWGRIVSLTSGGPLGFPGEASYGAAKAALENYTMTAALELGRMGVTANVVYPPVTDTGWITTPVEEFVATSSEHFHIGQPSDVADVIAWLCTDTARLVTANVIHLR